MNKQPKIGLLPLYLQLYDNTFPDLRNEFEPFMQTILDGLTEDGIEVVRAEICRLQPEFQHAIRFFEQTDVDLIVTLHLAYSLSLEAVDTLAASSKPILMLDTTMDYDFGMNVDPKRILFNHGIHGVQDLACMLRRRSVPFFIVSGHVVESNVLKRAANFARAAYAARVFKETKILRIGESFHGMGDFHVTNHALAERFGITVHEKTPDCLADAIRSLTAEVIENEIRRDRENYEVDLCEETHRRSVRVGLGLRKVLEEGDYNALSVNFLAFDTSEGLVDTVPFLEISKAMARGLGYAGEGDVLTAALVAALNGAFGRTTFTEIFCPDWKGGTVFLSHMGEINPRVAANKPRLCEKDFPWTKSNNPAVIVCAPASGPATFVNLAPGPDDTFRLIIAPVVVEEDTINPAMRDTVRGWFCPPCSLEEFLEEYALAGGTHHSALLLGNQVEALTAFADFIGIECHRIPAKFI
ncbi:MAG: hypothetical protein C4527_10025 [Candidatus Omnitrophota bacterium]|jgi:L-arabinose isomerase|nr:MAG: hypothetical protein C4527_10025 [Candidatus Omnitrophota bacterium]